MIDIDGSVGEGGGQIIRTSLALALVTGKSFAVHKVRSGREKPGLQNQHLTCVKAAAEIGNAQVDGAHLRSTAFTFKPGCVQPGSYRFNVGTAGSVLLVLQTILPPLMVSSGPSSIILEGGTHNPHAPPFDFIAETFVPLINRMGPTVGVELERLGFYPPGGGKINVSIEPAHALSRLSLQERGATRVSARCLVIKLPRSVAQRELAVLSRCVPSLAKERLTIEESTNALSPGNVLVVSARSDQVCETVTQIGERGLRAEIVAERAAAEVNRYLSCDVAVGEHLADQLLLPMAMAGGGSYLTLPPTRHTTTNIEVIKRFLEIDIRIERVADERYRVSLNC